MLLLTISFKIKHFLTITGKEYQKVDIKPFLQKTNLFDLSNFSTLSSTGIKLNKRWCNEFYHGHGFQWQFAQSIIETKMQYSSTKSASIRTCNSKGIFRQIVNRLG